MGVKYGGLYPRYGEDPVGAITEMLIRNLPVNSSLAQRDFARLIVELTQRGY